MIPLNANSLSERKGDLRSRKIARFGLVISLSLAMTIAFQKNDSDAYSQYKTQHYKQYAFIELNDLDQYYCLEELWFKESRWNPKADNPRSTAYGIPQLLNLKEQNPFRQIDIGLRYIEHRYSGCACKALAHHKIKGWY
jgi:hypothetical protein